MEHTQKRSLNHSAVVGIDCKRCEKLVASRNQIVYGYGDNNAKIMLVGMAPGRNGADITGVPFTRDPSGVLLQECLIAAGFSLESDPKNEHPKLRDIYITNLVKCNPKEEGGRNRTPSQEEIFNCLPFFEQEIREINPEIIVTFGKVATEHALKKKISRFMDLHNKSFQKDERIYLPFIHPSYVIRGAYKRQQYIDEFIGVKELLHSL